MPCNFLAYSKSYDFVFASAVLLLRRNSVASVSTAVSIPPRKDPDSVAKFYAENGRIPSFSEMI